MESSGAAEQKLLENGTSSQSSSSSSSLIRKGGLRTMPFIIGISHSLQNSFIALTHLLFIIGDNVVLLTSIEKWISERVFGASGQLRDHAEHDTVPAQRLRHDCCQGHKRRLHLVCYLRHLVHLRCLYLRFLFGSIPRHFYRILLQPSCKST